MKVLISLVLTTMVYTQAQAQPPKNVDPLSPTAQWYKSLKQPDNNVSCCSLSDCREHPEAKIKNGHWQVLYDNKWIIVPDRVILKRENPVGVPVVCIMGGYVLCFVPPSES